MKKIIISFCFITSVQTVFAQNNSQDNAKAALARYSNPMERFTETIKYLETIDSYSSNNIDSAICIDLLQIAQQLKNDSLLAISYNWIGYYFLGSKGDNSTSLAYYFKVLPLAEQFNDKRRIISLYFVISQVYHNFNTRATFFHVHMI